MYLIAIAAIGKNRELGFQGEMPWKHALKKDLAFFKEQTMNHTVVMGRKTYESLPGPLKGRHMVVLTSSPIEGTESYPDWESFQQAYRDHEDPVYLIGGASLYNQFLDQADELLLTEIDQSFRADRTFPSFPYQDYERILLSEGSDAGFSYQRARYLPKKKKGNKSGM